MPTCPGLRIFTICLLSVCSFGLQGNDAINLFLAQAQDALPLASATDISVDAGWVEQADLRLGATDQQEQSLALRFRPKFALQRNTENRIMELLGQRRQIEIGSKLNDELRRRYLRLLELTSLFSEQQYLSVRVDLAAEMLRMNRGLVASDNFRLGDLQSAEFELQSQQRKLLQLQAQLQLESGIEGLESESLREFSLAQMMSTPQLADIADALARQVADEAPAIGSDRLDWQLAQQELLLARAAGNSWLKHVELKFDYAPSGEQQTSLGLAIPLGRDEQQTAWASSRLNRASFDLQLRQQQLAQQARQHARQLTWQWQQQLNLKQDADLLRQQLSRLRGADQPLLLLKLRREIIDLEQAIARNRFDALGRHIDLLQLAGYLSARPLKNWLLPDQPLI